MGYVTQNIFLSKFLLKSIPTKYWIVGINFTLEDVADISFLLCPEANCFHRILLNGHALILNSTGHLECSPEPTVIRIKIFRSGITSLVWREAVWLVWSNDQLPKLLYSWIIGSGYSTPKYLYGAQCSLHPFYSTSWYQITYHKRYTYVHQRETRIKDLIYNVNKRLSELGRY